MNHKAGLIDADRYLSWCRHIYQMQPPEVKNIDPLLLQQWMDAPPPTKEQRQRYINAIKQNRKSE